VCGVWYVVVWCVVVCGVFWLWMCGACGSDSPAPCPLTTTRTTHGFGHECYECFEWYHPNPTLAMNAMSACFEWYHPNPTLAMSAMSAMRGTALRCAILTLILTLSLTNLASATMP
jgi:hypothetical protein